MILLSSIPKNHIVLNCRCGYVGMIAVEELNEVHGDHVYMDAVEGVVSSKQKVSVELRSFT